MYPKLKIQWSFKAQADVKQIYFDLLKRNSKSVSQKIKDEILIAPESIIFPNQYQIDEYVTECRRIVIRNYKILYLAEGETITIISVFNTHRHPSKMKGIL